MGSSGHGFLGLLLLCQVRSDIQASTLELCAPCGWERREAGLALEPRHPVRAFRSRAPENRTELGFLCCLARFPSSSPTPGVVLDSCACLGRTACDSEGDELKQLICLAASSRDKAREIFLVWQQKHHELRDSGGLIDLDLFVLTYLVFLCTSANSVLEVQNLEVGWGYWSCW